jgi:seryl-tRNA synthetase
VTENEDHNHIDERDMPVRAEKDSVDDLRTRELPSTESENKFDALVRDRDSLRAEVTEMRKSLEEIQLKHEEEMGALQRQLADSETKREQAEHQFQKLLERVNTIKSQLGERLKEDAV